MIELLTDQARRDGDCVQIIACKIENYNAVLETALKSGHGYRNLTCTLIALKVLA